MFCRTPGKTSSNPDECADEQPVGVRRCVGTTCEGTVDVNFAHFV